MARIPRTYVTVDTLEFARDFDFATSTDPVVVEERQELRGRGVNIVADQTAGIDVGMRTFNTLSGDPELSKIWAQVLGGATINSAMYTLREERRQPMSRQFELAGLVDDNGMLLDDGTRLARTLASLAGVHSDSGVYETTVATKRDPALLGHNLGRTSTLLGVYGRKFKHPDSEFAIMTEARAEVKKMHEAARDIARSTDYNPSLAQLRSDITPLGGHIVRSRAYGLDLKRAFRDSAAEVNDRQGY